MIDRDDDCIMKTEDRKAVIAAYKERTTVSGIYAQRKHSAHLRRAWPANSGQNCERRA
jgi:hypothetical protein